MGDFELSKNLTAIGSLLMIIPGVNIIGAILIFIGMKGLSEYYKDDNIFNSVLKGIIFGVIGVICAVATLDVVWYSVIRAGYYGGGIASFVSGIILGIMATIVLLIIAFVFMLLMATNLRKAFDTLGDRSGEKLFYTAGTFLWFGAILTIIIGFGVVLVFIAYILLTIAFFSLKESPTKSAYSCTLPPNTQSTSTESVPNTNGPNFCPNCGTSVSAGAVFCTHCGKQIC
ncbi:MAG: DUF996 domain-containing protein [Candidatus Bathyarchaeota archaeon]|nr:DUF996 domain-containing protein [Candidatus Termiticorpusculum sp.]